MAMPMKRATPGPWCDGFTSGAFDSASSFTLAAYNSTGPNSNMTGAPLVLGTAGTTKNAQFWHFITEASWPNDISYPTVSLVNGTLIPNGADGAKPAQAASVDSGNSLEFFSSATANPDAGAQIYCGVRAAAGFSLLAVNGDTGSFSLCQATNQNVVFYKAAPNMGYDYDSCYPVVLQMLPQ
ncbi:hypothetical protein GY45DRAFT_1346536 [Cubamyces sp. BRFM 1775]|nr:hypothetical protein GY45DRAFT_1346536 [Cubamyces sp. BRFM 1775]